MIKGLFKLLLALCICIVAFSCKKNKLFKGTPIISFSSDTLTFDTVFTTIGSTTGYFKIYNKYNQRINLARIRLQGGATSIYRLNIDGKTGNDQTNIEIEANDSIYVFVSVTVNPNNQNNPLVVYDKVLVESVNNTQSIVLQAWGQDVYIHRHPNYFKDPHNANNLAFDASGTWNNDKPHLVFGFGIVPGGTTLNIKPGTKIYMHSNAYLEVFGKLTALGNKNDSIVFQGDRLEHYYDELPGQWGGLIFIRNCQPCSLVHVIIKNAGTGIIAGSDTTSNVSAYNISTAPKIYLEKCVIKNCDENAVFGFLSDITAINSLFYNCSKQVVQLLFGGIYNFKHCTIANYENTNIEHQTPCLRISNWAGFNNAAVLTDVDVKFTNSIIYGSIDKNKEIIIDKDYGVPTGTTFNYLFQHCLLKTDIATSSFPSNFLSCMINQNPMFASTNLNANFTLITGSPAIDNGLKTLGVIDDINDASRDANPDMGCYEK